MGYIIIEQQYMMCVVRSSTYLFHSECFIIVLVHLFATFREGRKALAWHSH